MIGGEKRSLRVGCDLPFACGVVLEVDTSCPADEAAVAAAGVVFWGHEGLGSCGIWKLILWSIFE